MANLKSVQGFFSIPTTTMKMWKKPAHENIDDSPRIFRGCIRFASYGAAFPKILDRLWNGVLKNHCRGFVKGRNPVVELPVILLCVCGATLAMSCAHSPQAEMRGVYADYLDACAREDNEAAAVLLSEPYARIDPCPDMQAMSGRTDAIPAADEIGIAVQTPRARFIQSGDRFRIDPGSFFDPDRIHNRLRALKYAIKNEDVSALSELIVSRRRPSPEFLSEWIVSAAAGEIYAAVAANSDTWFEVSVTRAMCSLSGIELRFEVEDGVWMWDYEWK